MKRSRSVSNGRYEKKRISMSPSNAFCSKCLTFLKGITRGCEPISASYRKAPRHPGIEPEIDGDAHPIIREIGWFHLRQPDTWDPLLYESEITYRMVQQVREALGCLL